MKIEWDSALVSALAATLDRRFRGDRVRAVHLDPVARRAELYLKSGVWIWDLHPERIAFRIAEPRDAPPEAVRLPAKVGRVTAIPDDRVMEVHLRRVRGRPAQVSLVLELIPNRENALVLEDEERTIRRLLRTREEADRTLRRGQPWAAPTPSGRRDGWDRAGWMEHFLPLDPSDRRRALLTGVAWTSPLVVDALLGDATELDGPPAEVALERGYDRWLQLSHAAVDPDRHSPTVLLARGNRTPQPYPVPLPDRVLAEVSDLLEAFDRAAREAGSDDPSLIPGALVERLEDEIDRAEGRRVRLRREFSELSAPGPIRALGDLLLARFSEIPSGADRVTLTDFEGREIEVELDPTLPPNANARKFYDRAARIERAAERLPDLIGAAESRVEELRKLSAQVDAGEVGRDGLEAELPDRPTGPDGGSEEGPSLPYRIYRSSGGFEIRVGRGAARNDDLTFHHSRPDDIWMHATQVAGAHVVLRWNGEGSPPPRDLAEAATLAALHSKARTSGTVPVAWTRRKYVRKPRKAPPGAVLPDRVETIFVRPDRKLEERLRVDDQG